MLSAEDYDNMGGGVITTSVINASNAFGKAN